MRSMLTALCFVASSAWLAPGTAWAAPGDGYDESHIKVLDSEEVSCPRPTSLCLRPGDAMTRPTGTPATTTGGWFLAATDEASGFMRMPITRRDRTVAPDDSMPWVIDVGANLRRPALAGNALFLLYDTQDPHAVAKHQVTALWQAHISGGNQVAARLTLTPDDGFRADHTYRLRVVQLIGSKEVTLTDGMIRLQ